MSYNHQPSILHHDKYGYVACCSGCMNFQVGFGNVYMNQTLEDLKDFSRVISKYYHQNKNRLDCKRKDIFIDSPCPGFGIIFSASDLERMNHILQKTLLILASKDQVRLQ